MSDDKEDKEDKDDDKKADKPAEQSKELGAKMGTAIRFRSTIKFLSFRAVWQIWKPQV